MSPLILIKSSSLTSLVLTVLLFFKTATLSSSFLVISPTVGISSFSYHSGGGGGSSIRNNKNIHQSKQSSTKVQVALCTKIDDDVSDENSHTSMDIKSTRRRAIMTFMIGTCTVGTIPQIGLDMSHSAIASADDTATGTSSQGNDDPLATFGASLNQMNFDGTTGTGTGIGSMNSSFNNGSSSSGGATYGGQQQQPVGKNLNDMLEEKKKQRSIDPRTHG